MKTFIVLIFISVIAFKLDFKIFGLVVGYASLLALASELFISIKITKK